jgi:cAMP-binding proteins - catabolite gene activator and regulatory subunit of cAMP-dependent protein kinases
MSVQTLEIGEVSPQVGSAIPAQITPQSSSPGPFETMGLLIAYTRNEEIYGEGEAAEFLYKVKSGCVRTYKVLNDGRRQIASFYLPGDVFGLTVGEQHTSSAEASVASEVIAIKRSALRSRASVDSALALLLMGLAVMELQRTQDHALLLIKTAQERVATFLLDLAKREASDSEVQLPMSRQEIADYLGLTIETVSRTLTLLENTAAITLPTSRRIILRNRPTLSKMNA